MGFMVITMLIALLPGFVDMFDIAQNSQNLNCVGYTDTIISDGNYSYNATIGARSTIACLAMKLYLPYIVLAVLIGLVVKILYDKGTSQQAYPY